MTSVQKNISLLTMYMNMRIIMNMNIYIEPRVEEQLRKEHSMSGLINTLLKEYYGSKISIADKDINDIADKMDKETKPDVIFPIIIKSPKDIPVEQFPGFISKDYSSRKKSNKK